MALNRQKEIILELLSLEEINKMTGLNLSPESLDFLQYYLPQANFSEIKAEQKAQTPKAETKVENSESLSWEQLKQLKQFNKVATKLGKDQVTTAEGAKKAIAILEKYQEMVKAVTVKVMTEEGINDAKAEAKKLIEETYKEHFSQDSKEQSIFVDPLTDEELEIFQKMIELNNVQLPKAFNLNTTSIVFIRKLLTDCQTKFNNDIDSAKKYFKTECENNSNPLCNTRPTDLTQNDLEFIQLLNLDKKLITATTFPYIKTILVQCRVYAFKDQKPTEDQLAAAYAYFDSAYVEAFTQTETVVESSVLYPNLEKFKALAIQHQLMSISIQDKYKPYADHFAKIFNERYQANDGSFKKIYMEVYLRLFSNTSNKIEALKHKHSIQEFLLAISDEELSSLVTKLQAEKITEVQKAITDASQPVFDELKADLEKKYEAEQESVKTAFEAYKTEYAKNYKALQAALEAKYPVTDTLAAITEEHKQVLQALTVCRDKIGQISALVPNLETSRQKQYNDSLTEFTNNINSYQSANEEQHNNAQAKLTAFLQQIDKPTLPTAEPSADASLSELKSKHEKCLAEINERQTTYIDQQHKQVKQQVTRIFSGTEPIKTAVIQLPKFSADSLNVSIATVVAKHEFGQDTLKSDLAKMDSLNTAFTQLQATLPALEALRTNITKLSSTLDTLEKQCRQETQKPTEVPTFTEPTLPSIVTAGVHQRGRSKDNSPGSPVGKYFVPDNATSANATDSKTVPVHTEVKDTVVRSELEVLKLRGEVSRLYGNVSNIKRIVKKIIGDIAEKNEVKAPIQPKEKQNSSVFKSFAAMFSSTTKKSEEQQDTTNIDELNKKCKILQLAVENKDSEIKQILATDCNARVKLESHVSKLKSIVENKAIVEAICNIDALLGLTTQQDNKFKEFTKNTCPRVITYIYESLQSFVFELNAISVAANHPILSNDTVSTLSRITPDHPDAEKNLTNLLTKIQSECQAVGIDIKIAIPRDRKNEIKDGSVQFLFSKNEAARMETVYKAMGRLQDKVSDGAKVKEFIGDCLRVKWTESNAVEQYNKLCSDFDALTAKWDPLAGCAFPNPIHKARPDLLAKHGNKDRLFKANAALDANAEESAKTNEDRLCRRIC